jgi:hypothetical protein
MGAWKPGQSGNPSGKAKETDAQIEAKNLARDNCKLAIETLLDILQTGNAKERALAAQIILDRGMGKPSQEIQHTGKDGADLIPSISISVIKKD